MEGLPQLNVFFTLNFTRAIFFALQPLHLN